MLIPKITACESKNCSTLSIKEITGVYNSLKNLTGWGTPNLDISQVVTATLTILSPSGTTTNVNVLTQIPSTYFEPFFFNDIPISSEDGDWVITYTISDGKTTYRNNTHIFMTCSIRCCIDKVWEKALKDNTNCDCNCVEESELINKAMFMESLYMSLFTTESCNNSDTRDKILKQIQRLCKFEKCNC